MSDTPKAVGWFVKEGQLITILPEEDQSADEAIKEEAQDHGVDVSDVERGEAPDNWKETWEKKHGEKKKPEEKKKEESKPVEADSPPSDPSPPKADAAPAGQGLNIDLGDTDKPSDTPPPQEGSRSIDWSGISNDLISHLWRG